jgi:hypothetical protein
MLTTSTNGQSPSGIKKQVSDAFKEVWAASDLSSLKGSDRTLEQYPL